MKMNKITSLDFLFPNNEKELGEDSIIGKSSKNRDRDLEFIYKEYNNLCIENQKIPYYEELNSRIHNYNINLYTLIVYKDLCRENSITDDTAMLAKQIASEMYNQDCFTLSMSITNLIFEVLDSKRLPYYDDYNKETFCSYYGMRWEDFDILVNPCQTVISKELYECLTGCSFKDNYFIVVDRRGE